MLGKKNEPVLKTNLLSIAVTDLLKKTHHTTETIIAIALFVYILVMIAMLLSALIHL